MVWFTKSPYLLVSVVTDILKFCGGGLICEVIYDVWCLGSIYSRVECEGFDATSNHHHTHLHPLRSYSYRN